MARYMLDTDTCSCIMKRSNQTVIKRLRGVAVPDICISVITKSELLYEGRGIAGLRPTGRMKKKVGSQ